MSTPKIANIYGGSMTVHKAPRRAGRVAALPGRPEKVEMSQVRFSAGDVRLLVGFLLLLITGLGWFVNKTAETVVTKLQLTMATTYVAKDEFRQSESTMNDRLKEIHDDLARQQQVKK